MLPSPPCMGGREKNNIAQNHLYRNNTTDQHVQTNNPKVQIDNLSLDEYDIIEMDDPDLQPKDNCLDPDDTQLSNTSDNSNDLSHILENDLQITPEPLPNTSHTGYSDNPITNNPGQTDKTHKTEHIKRNRSPSPDTHTRADRRLRPIKRVKYGDVLHATDFLDDVLLD